MMYSIDKQNLIFLGELQFQQLSKTVISRATDVQFRWSLHGWKAYKIIYNFYSQHFFWFCQ